MGLPLYLAMTGGEISGAREVPHPAWMACHFSPYGLYVDVSNLASGDLLDSSPKTGDPIHPKWFLVIGLMACSILLFMRKDPQPKKA